MNALSYTRPLWSFTSPVAVSLPAHNLSLIRERLLRDELGRRLVLLDPAEAERRLKARGREDGQ